TMNTSSAQAAQTIKENNMKQNTQDGLLHLSLMGGQARALLIDSTQMCEAARQTHNLSRVATAALGRLLTVSCMMGVMLKGEQDSITAIVKGDGPLGTLMAVSKPDGSVKGYVDHPEVDIPRRPDGKLAVGDAVGHHGEITVIRDMGFGEPYIGKTHLVTGEIAEDFAMYFTASEQTPSLVSLGVLTNDEVLSAGGLIVQMMPGADEAAIQSVEQSVDMFRDISGTIEEYRLEGSVMQLLGHLEPEIIGRVTPAYRCDCSRERIERALISMGAEELNEMIEQQHGAEVGCHFCNRKWAFSEDQLRALLEAARS
ncbi:Hsp33 family molecular chaperone HslO, partial [Eubacteriales bacterium OttesenSCG-928-N13]|nr:Hsp33 family molecular chaperone HslO [Eubacteriales bacterium OttesenSCG-928-N13]